jgi:hypothetical protein
LEYSTRTFVGHYAVAFACKRLAPRTSLATFAFGSQFSDLLFPVLLLIGIEHVGIAPGISRVTAIDFYDYPVSHSLMMTIVWALLISAIYWVLRHNTRSPVLLGLAVLSHWVFDFLSHRPDMPVTLHGPTRLGLGLWNSIPATILVEGGLFAGGVWLYLNVSCARDRSGEYGLLILIALMSLIWIASIFGPPPPSASAVGWVDLAQWLLIALLCWIDRHRIAGLAPGS